MAETRTVKVTAVMTPVLHKRLVAYADEHSWSLSTALVELAREGLSAADQRRSRASK